MAFKDTYRLEKVYYENMWTLLKSLKALKENPSADEITKVNEILDDTIACNESIIIIYKNLGELYAEVAQKFVDLLTDLKAVRDDLEMWKNEINEKIDDVNNYLMGHIRDLDDRVTSLEGRVSDLEDRMTTAENDIDALEGRMDTAEGDIDALEGRMDTAEGDIDALEGRMDTAEDDIDGLQDDVSDLEQNKQDKLTAGFGIEIDANNEISVDTNDVQEKLIAGQNITLTPDATDPTKTVIDAQGGGSSYTAGKRIAISNNEISVSEPTSGVAVMNYSHFVGNYNAPLTGSNYHTISMVKDIDLSGSTYDGCTKLYATVRTRAFVYSTDANSMYQKLLAWQNKHDFGIYVGVIHSVNANGSGGNYMTIAVNSKIKFDNGVPVSDGGTYYTNSVTNIMSQAETVYFDAPTGHVCGYVVIECYDNANVADIKAFINSLTSSDLNLLLDLYVRAYK